MRAFSLRPRPAHAADLRDADEKMRKCKDVLAVLAFMTFVAGECSVLRLVLSGSQMIFIAISVQVI